MSLSTSEIPSFSSMYVTASTKKIILRNYQNKIGVNEAKTVMKEPDFLKWNHCFLSQI